MGAFYTCQNGQGMQDEFTSRDDAGGRILLLAACGGGGGGGDSIVKQTDYAVGGALRFVAAAPGSSTFPVVLEKGGEGSGFAQCRGCRFVSIVLIQVTSYEKFTCGKSPGFFVRSDQRQRSRGECR